MTDRELLELIAAKVASLDEGQKSLVEEMKDVKKIVLNIEQDHGKKLEALFDGYKQNTEKLNRIEEEVSKHEEIILRRVR